MEEKAKEGFNIDKRSWYSIKGVPFTERELDILACIANGRISRKSIAHLLSISPGTVATHNRNIMQKLGCSSLDHVRTFIEQSDNIKILRSHYDQLISKENFFCTLGKIKKALEGQFYSCNLECDEAGSIAFSQIKKVLEFVGIKVNASEVGVPTLYVHINLTPQEQRDIDHFYFYDHSSVEILTLDILSKILGNKKIDYFISEFKKGHRIPNSIPNISEELVIEQNVDLKLFSENVAKSFFIYLDKKTISLAFIIFFLMIGGYRYLALIPENIYSELQLPSEEFRVERIELSEKIREKLYCNNLKEKISVVTINGIGGSGKTTLARLIAQKHKGITWELNATSRINLISSFKGLAYALASSITDREHLQFINSLPSQNSQEKQILLFVAKKLQKKPNWLLIFDNIRSYSDVKDYLPQQPHLWGKGYVIATTRNATLKIGNTITVHQLSEQETFELFTKIIPPQYKVSTGWEKNVKSFLKNIPPFPLDILVAGIYIQRTGIELTDYLGRLHKKTIDSIQGDFLRQTKDYPNTRREIITVSLKELVSHHSEYLPLLFMISVLDFKNILREILEIESDELVVDRLLNDMKKYSLIGEELRMKGLISYYIHPSTQSILHQYLINIINKEEFYLYSQKLISSVEKYVSKVIDYEMSTEMSWLNLLLENLINSSILPDNFLNILLYLRANLLISLFQHNDPSILQDMKNCLNIFSKDKNTNALRIANILSSMGEVYRFKGRSDAGAEEYSEGIRCLEESLKIFNQQKASHSLAAARAMTHLGNLYRTMGRYKDALILLTESAEIYKQNLPVSNEVTINLECRGQTLRDQGKYLDALEILDQCMKEKIKHKKNPISILWTSSFIGNVYLDLGCYKKAQQIFTNVVNEFKKTFSTNSETFGWALAQLGSSYVSIDDPKSLSILEEAQRIFDKPSNKHHIIYKTILPSLGKIYISSGQLQKAKLCLNKSLKLLQTHYGDDHIRTACVRCCLGEISLKEGDLEEAEKLMLEALSILEKNLI